MSPVSFQKCALGLTCVTFIFAGLKLCFLILKHTDNLATALQTTRYSAGDGMSCAVKTIEFLQGIRGDFGTFYQDVCDAADDDALGKTLGGMLCST